MASVGMGDILIGLRNERQLTMDMLVEDINYKYDMKINKSMVSRWERNENDPSLEMAVVLAKYYNVSLDYLIGLTDVKTPARLLASASKKQSEPLLIERPVAAAVRPGLKPGQIPPRPEIKIKRSTTNDDDFEFEFLDLDDENPKKRKK